MKCLLDMDGVLVDFLGGAHKFHNIPYDENNYPYEYGEWLIAEKTGMSDEDFWKGLDGEFWANLDWKLDGREILALVESIFGQDNICLVSCPTLHPESLSGKLQWIQRELPAYHRRYLLGPTKQFCASPHTVLVDDADHNVEQFRKCGGSAITVPRKWNQLYNYNPIEGIKLQLAVMGIGNG